MKHNSKHLLPAVEQRLEALELNALADEPSLQSIHCRALRAGGSRRRAALALAVSTGLGLADEDAISIATGIEVLHQASLVHDDLQDHDRHRRGQPAVWSEYGEAIAICLGDALIAKAFDQFARVSLVHHVPQLIRAASQAVATMSAGQALDCSRVSDVDYAVYERVVRAKSGPLLALPFTMPLLCADAHAGIIQQVNCAAESVGIAYQLADDWEDREQDKHKHLNGYWVLARSHGDAAAEAELRSHFKQHTEIARDIPDDAPATVRLAVSDLVAWVCSRFPAGSEAATRPERKVTAVEAA